MGDTHTVEYAAVVGLGLLPQWGGKGRGAAATGNRQQRTGKWQLKIAVLGVVGGAVLAFVLGH